MRKAWERKKAEKGQGEGEGGERPWRGRSLRKAWEREKAEKGLGEGEE